jgi:tRNA(Ile)-lysidine synthase
MAGPDRAVAAARLAVRGVLARPDAGTGPVVVACSGGADSLALVAAVVFECRRDARPVIGATVDHALQQGSAERAALVVEQMAGLGVTETLTARVSVEPAGQGVEAAAREARYAVLEEVARRAGSSVVLLGHTQDDQAETVLLGLTRGSGGRSVAGMRRLVQGEDVSFFRPFLELTRVQTEQVCRAHGLEPWADPHNEDPRFTRARVRHRVLPVLEEELGPGVAVTLARTAELLRADMELLDRLADTAYDDALRARTTGEVVLGVPELTALDPALRGRVLRRAALEAGSPGDELFRVHVVAVEELVTAWRGQRMVQLPGHRSAVRSGDTLTIGRTPVAG